MTNLEDLLGKLHAYAMRTCMESDGAVYTYKELLDEFKNWRAHLERMNVGPGTVVGIRADHSMFATAVLLALFSRGAVAALLPSGGDANDYLLDACATVYLELADDGAYEWTPLQKAASHPLLSRLSATGGAGLVIFTSGSSGNPKAALHGVDKFLWKFRKSGRQLRTIAFLKFDHIAGMDTILYTLASGGALILTRRRDPHSILELIESRNVEVLPTSPSFLRILCATSDFVRHDLSSLKVITYGSEPMDPTTLARVNERFPNVEISQKYGTTETGSPRTVSRARESTWLKFKGDGVETKVVDEILWIRSQGAFLGYLNAPAILDASGWYCTGDLVDVDGEWIRFRGRATDMINVGGEKVAPAEVERTIHELEFVRGVVVAGVPHSILGQIVSALVALEPITYSGKEALKLIRAHCRKRLPSFKVPMEIELVDQIPVTSRQKAKRMP